MNREVGISEGRDQRDEDEDRESCADVCESTESFPIESLLWGIR
jgi:hypothetical protein